MTSKTRKNSPVQPASDEEFIRLEGALEHLRIMLSVEMKDLRHRRGMTQAQLAKRLDCNQSWVSKVESADQNTGIESILRYLFELDADLILGVLDEQRFLPVTEAAEHWWESIEHRVNPLDEAPSATKKPTNPKKKLVDFESGAREMAASTINSRQVEKSPQKLVG